MNKDLEPKFTEAILASISHLHDPHARVGYLVDHIFNPLNRARRERQKPNDEGLAVKHLEENGNGVREILKEVSGSPEYTYLMMCQCWMAVKNLLNDELPLPNKRRL